jgi:hypothetical protein
VDVEAPVDLARATCRAIIVAQMLSMGQEKEGVRVVPCLVSVVSSYLILSE